MAADFEETTATEHQSLQGLAQDPPALSTGDIASDPDSQGEGALQLLPCGWKHQLTVDILPGGGQTALQVVESKGPKAESDLEGNQTGIGDVCFSDAHPVRSDGMESGACVKAHPSVRVSMTEEAGAGKPLAGICAGGAG